MVRVKLKDSIIKAYCLVPVFSFDVDIGEVGVETRIERCDTFCRAPKFAFFRNEFKGNEGMFYGQIVLDQLFIHRSQVSVAAHKIRIHR